VRKADCLYLLLPRHIDREVATDWLYRRSDCAEAILVKLHRYGALAIVFALALKHALRGIPVSGGSG